MPENPLRTREFIALFSLMPAIAPLSVVRGKRNAVAMELSEWFAGNGASTLYPIVGSMVYGPAMEQAIRIIGIDPGLRRTGWGIIECCGSRLSFVAAGTVTSANGSDLAERLRQLYAGLSAVIGRHGPGEAAVEATFVNRDAAAALKLGQARGIAMLVPAQAGLSVAEYAPNQVKKTVVGTGHGAKQQIRTMVSLLLPKAEFDSDDAADALAIAICHAHHRSSPAGRLAAAVAGAGR